MVKVRRIAGDVINTYSAMLKESAMTEGGPPSLDGTEIIGKVHAGPGSA